MNYVKGNYNNKFNQSFSGYESTPNNLRKKEELQGSLIQNMNYSVSNASAFLNNLNPLINQENGNLQSSIAENKLPSLFNLESTLKKFSKINLNNSKLNNDPLQICELETKMAENIVISEASNYNSNQNDNSVNMQLNNNPNNYRNSQINNLKFNNTFLNNLNMNDKNKHNPLNNNSNKDENNKNVNSICEKDYNPSNNNLGEINNTNITTPSNSYDVINKANINPNSSTLKSVKNFNYSNCKLNANSDSMTNNNYNINPNVNFLKRDLHSKSNTSSEANLQTHEDRKKSYSDLTDSSNANSNNINNNLNLNTNANTHNTYTNTNPNLININSIYNANGTPQPIRHTSSYTNTNSTYNCDESKNPETNKVKHIEELHLELVRMIQNYNMAVRVQEKDNEEDNNMQTVNGCEEKDIN